MNRKYLSKIRRLKNDFNKKIKRICQEANSDKNAVAELARLKYLISHRARLECDLHISPYDLSQYPDDFIDFKTEEAMHDLAKGIVKNMQKGVVQRIKDELNKVKVESMFSRPYGETINISILVPQIDTIEVTVTRREK